MYLLTSFGALDRSSVAIERAFCKNLIFLATNNAAAAAITITMMKRSNQIIIHILLITTIIIVLQSFSLTSITTTHKTNDYRRSLQSESIPSTLYQYNNAVENTPYTEYTNLQSLADIDTSIEINAQANANNNKEQCKRLMIYMPDNYSDHGHGSQINRYIMSIVTATYLNRALLLLEPPLDGRSNHYEGGSQFGCPIDAFHEAMNQQSYNIGMSSTTEQEAILSSLTSDARTSKVNEALLHNNFPLGFSRLIQHPTWLSHNCQIPKYCSDGRLKWPGGDKTYKYKDWKRLYNSGLRKLDKNFKEWTCYNEDGSHSNVVVTAAPKRGLSGYFHSHEKNMAMGDPYTSWATNLGATNNEAEVFNAIQSDSGKMKEVLPYLLGLLNKAGFLKLQPWIARDVQHFLMSFDLPMDQEYSAIHVRRGDKLEKEAARYVQQYWRVKGYKYPYPTDYVPFEQYLSKWDGPELCELNQRGVYKIIRHNVYIATDDPITVKQEIADLDTKHINERTIMWNNCHELTFYFNPTDASAFHLNGEGEKGFISKGEWDKEDNCFDRYHRNIASVTDMMILAKAKTFIGEYNSNWGRVIQAVRVRLNDNMPIPGDINEDVMSSIRQNNMMQYGTEKFTRTLDMRIAWGPIANGLH